MDFRCSSEEPLGGKKTTHGRHETEPPKSGECITVENCCSELLSIVLYSWRKWTMRSGGECRLQKVSLPYKALRRGDFLSDIYHSSHSPAARWRIHNRCMLELKFYVSSKAQFTSLKGIESEIVSEAQSSVSTSFRRREALEPVGPRVDKQHFNQHSQLENLNPTTANQQTGSYPSSWWSGCHFIMPVICL